jgi:hypothetical protein
MFPARAGRDVGRFLAAVGPIAALAEAQLVAAAACVEGAKVRTTPSCL